MGYSSFTMATARHAFGLKARGGMIFDPVARLEPSPWLVEALSRGQEHAVFSEKARGEFIVVLEAKKADIEEGYGQCAAEMLGAVRLNEKEGRPVPYVYGCVTNGNVWHFLKLENKQLLLHPEQLQIADLPNILWFLVECVRDIDRRGPDLAA